MKTEFEISSAISNYITSNEGVTDFPVTLKQISDEVDTLRVRVITDLDEKGSFKRPFLNYTQTIKINGTSTDAITRERYVKVPRFVILKSGKPAITYCGDYNGTQHFRVVQGLQREWHKADKWIGRLPTVVVIEDDNDGGYILKFRNISPNKIRLVGVFEDPSDLEPFGYDGTITVAAGGSLYPMPSGQVDVIIGKTVESYLRTLYRHPVQANQTVDAPNQQKEAV